MKDNFEGIETLVGRIKPVGKQEEYRVELKIIQTCSTGRNPICRSDSDGPIIKYSISIAVQLEIPAKKRFSLQITFKGDKKIEMMNDGPTVVNSYDFQDKQHRFTTGFGMFNGYKYNALAGLKFHKNVAANQPFLFKDIIENDSLQGLIFKISNDQFEETKDRYFWVKKLPSEWQIVKGSLKPDTQSAIIWFWSIIPAVLLGIVSYLLTLKKNSKKRPNVTFTIMIISSSIFHYIFKLVFYATVADLFFIGQIVVVVMFCFRTKIWMADILGWVSIGYFVVMFAVHYFLPKYFSVITALVIPASIWVDRIALTRKKYRKSEPAYYRKKQPFGLFLILYVFNSASFLSYVYCSAAAAEYQYQDKILVESPGTITLIVFITQVVIFFAGLGGIIYSETHPPAFRPEVVPKPAYNSNRSKPAYNQNRYYSKQPQQQARQQAKQQAKSITPSLGFAPGYKPTLSNSSKKNLARTTQIGTTVDHTNAEHTLGC